MKKLLLILLLLVNTLFANVANQLDLEVLKDFGIDSSFLDETSLQRAYIKQSTNENIKYHDNLLNKASLITKIVRDEVIKEELPFYVVFIPLIETGYVNKINKRGASGLWQIMPITAKHLKLRNDQYIDERLDLLKSTDAASSYLKKFYRSFGKWYLSVLAYNAGEGRIIDGIARASLDNYLEKNPNMQNDKVIKIYKIYLNEYKKNKKGMDNLYNIYRDIGVKNGYFHLSYLLRHNNERDYLPKITVNYLHKLVVFSMITNRGLFKNLDRKSKYELEKVKAPKNIHLKDISDAINMNYSEFKEINKHIRKETLPPDSKYNLYIPHTKLENFNSWIDKIKSTNITLFQDKVDKVEPKVKNEAEKISSKKISYIVKQGDTLGSIAQAYRINVKKLKSDNNKKSDKLKIGEKLEIYK